MVSGARKVILFRMTGEALLIAHVAGASVALRRIDEERERSGKDD
jgi:hypothetical protein